jgi:AbrB family looped-hinge helix DNA binding protein
MSQKKQSFGREIRKIVIADFPEVPSYKDLRARLAAVDPNWNDVKQSSLEAYRNDTVATLKLLSAADLSRYGRVMAEPKPAGEQTQPEIMVAESDECHVIDFTRARINQQGRIVIPAECRAAAGIEAGDELLIETLGKGELRLRTREQALREAQRIVARYSSGCDLVAELIAERREEAARE